MQYEGVFGTKHTTLDDLRKYMKSNKTECALAIYDSDLEITFPEYILEAINDDK